MLLHPKNMHANIYVSFKLISTSTLVCGDIQLPSYFEYNMSIFCGINVRKHLNRVRKECLHGY